MSRRIEAIAKWWQAEAARHFQWIPVGFAGGIAFYFALPTELPGYWLSAVFCLSILLAICFWNRARLPLLAFVLIATGAAWANISTHHHDNLTLREALNPRPVTGIVRDIERTEHGVRLTLDHTTIEGYPPELTPPRVRISVRLKKDSTLELPHIGDGINMRAGLRPPMGPALPHGFDFARFFFFKQIGAVGYGLPPWHVLDEAPPTTVIDQFWDWRIRITEDIIATLGKPTGGIAAGLITGDARAISEADFNDLRASNLYHIIAISGEHMVIIAGVIFVSLRLLALAALPRRLAFRPQVKTFAAVTTLALITAYLFVTGLPVSAVRAYFMIMLVLLAIILRRQVDAMRSLAITALIMLVWDPSTLFDPGFQLSFAATMAIVALVETAILRAPDKIEDGRFRRLFRLFLTMILISVVAEAATGPLVISMFNNASPYGVFANMLATSLVSFYLMPTVALYFILLPLGLEHGALWLMDWGIRGLLGIAHWVASLPHAQLFFPSIPGYGIALFVIGLLWLCTWQTRVRRYGIIAMVIGIATISIPSKPDLLVGGELKQLAFHSGDDYVLARGRQNSMVPNLWANGLGYRQFPKAGDNVWQCETRNKNCLAQVKGITVGFPADEATFTSYCTEATIIFTRDENAKCDNGTQVIDGNQLAGSNVIALWINDKHIRLEKSIDWQGNRPWSAIPADDDNDD